jgi:hypothetical protein
MEASEVDAKPEVSSGLSQLLFAPVFLVGETVGILFPGLLFCLILLLKGHRATFAPFDLAFLGYRTKLFGFLLIAYVIGKLLTAPLRLTLGSLIGKAKPEANEQTFTKKSHYGAIC